MNATRTYEALVILKAAGTEQDVARAAEALAGQIKKLGGTMDRSEPWGRRRLAFRISRQQEGYYQLLRFQAPPAQVAELERLFRLNETIVRFMILTEDELAPVAATASHPTPGPAPPARPEQLPGRAARVTGGPGPSAASSTGTTTRSERW